MLPINTLLDAMNLSHRLWYRFKKKMQVKCILYRLLSSTYFSDSWVFLLTGKHILNHQLFSPCQTASIHSLAHTVNNFHTPFSLHLVKRDLRDTSFTTLQSRQGDVSVNEKGLTDTHLGKEPSIYCFQNSFPTYSQQNVSQVNQLKCIIIKGILACNWGVEVWLLWESEPKTLQ